jgi:hypothetical protein
MRVICSRLNRYLKILQKKSCNQAEKKITFRIKQAFADYEEGACDFLSCLIVWISFLISWHFFLTSFKAFLNLVPAEFWPFE